MTNVKWKIEGPVNKLLVSCAMLASSTIRGGFGAFFVSWGVIAVRDCGI